ncbi:MAG: PepSY domain-containing protein, partial [Cyclobacteriaceae bacterium]|nr:PepSY domain-containing protein [Cyclobacteriaceae bacterium]
VHPADYEHGSIAANANPDADTYWRIDYRYFDQYTLAELPVDHIWNRFHEASVGEKLQRMNYDIHVGAIAGLPGKFLAFCLSAIIASLPITGFLIWRGRKKKRRKNINNEPLYA